MRTLAKSLVERHGAGTAFAAHTNFPVWYRLHSQNEANAAHQFWLWTREAVNAIELHLGEHEQVSLGGAGLFDACKDISRHARHTNAVRLCLNEQYKEFWASAITSSTIHSNESANQVRLILEEQNG